MDEGGVELAGDDVGDGGLAEAGRAVEQGMVEGVTAFPGSQYRNRNTVDDLFLADVIAKMAGAQIAGHALFNVSRIWRIFGELLCALLQRLLSGDDLGLTPGITGSAVRGSRLDYPFASVFI